jgi:hypothetical protein
MRKSFLIFTCILILGMLFPICLSAQTDVPANKAWTKTKIVLSKGDKVEASVIGTITIDNNVSCDANGLKIVSGPEHVALKNANRGALIAKIGKKGVPFVVGANGSFMVGTEGAIYFGINDDEVKNNTGKYTVTLSVNGTAK